jgi:hypothetical protein
MCGYNSAMRNVIALFCVTLLLAGCRSPKPAPGTAPPSAGKKPEQTYITPDFSAAGRVELVNSQGRFVVLSFPPGRVPAIGQMMRINHRGLKVGEVRITGPQREIDTVADLVEGEANVGDEAVPK